MEENKKPIRIRRMSFDDKDDSTKSKTETYIKVEGEYTYAPVDEYYHSFAAADLPQYSERINKQLNIVSFGDDNQYPNYLLSLLTSSSTHYAIVNNKAMYIGGNGFALNGLSNEALRFIANPYNEDDLEEILKKISLDLEVYSAIALNIIWNKDRTIISEINYINPRTLRIVAPEGETPEGKYEYAISKDWRNIRKEENKPVVYSEFSVIDRKKPSQILYVKEHRGDVYFYGNPAYISAADDIESDYLIGNFRKNNIKNGFSPQMTITFLDSGNISDEEIDFELSRLAAQYQGSKNAGTPMIFFADNKDNAPLIDILDAQQNGELNLTAEDKIVSKIMCAHQVVSPSIMGIPTPGALSSKNEMIQSLKVLQAEYINPKQEFIEKIFNRLARVNGIPDKIVISQYELDVEVDVDIKDILGVLESTITPEQKIAVFMASGYSEDEAKYLVEGVKGEDKKQVSKQSRVAFKTLKSDARLEMEKERYEKFITNQEKNNEEI
jgi:hypothetical protein